MKRRDFIKLSVATGSAILFPQYAYSRDLDLSQINFTSAVHNNNAAQTIIIFLYGGASQLAGNLTNLDEIRTQSQSNYNYFGTVTKTAHNFWKQAGGDAMEDLISSGDMTIFRTCYSQVREDNHNKAHAVCTLQNQRGSYELNGSGGVLSNLAQILEANNIVNSDTKMPFVTMEGDSDFYATGHTPVSSYLKPVGINETFKNPYNRRYIRRGSYYSDEEIKRAPDNFWKSDDEGGFDPALHQTMDKMAQQHNRPGKIKDAFAKRKEFDTFIKTLKASKTPDLGDDAYPQKNVFSKKLEAAVNIMVHNPDTKVLTMSTGGLGGWDDHSDARNYVNRMHDLFRALKSAMAHLHAEGKAQQINIMVFCEFGRNVNLNESKGWDHGNLQNFYVLGGKGYFNHKGVVGETELTGTGKVNRLFMKPVKGSYWFEPLSIAATLYKIYGIENPEILTDNYPVITPLFS